MRLIFVSPAVVLGVALFAGHAETQEGRQGAMPPAAIVEPDQIDVAPPGPTHRRDSDTCMPERTIVLGPAETARHIGFKTYRQTLRLADHEVVLTFDDGPSPKTSLRVLAALKAACVHATFFLIGRNTTAHPEIAQRELAEGHSVGHHSMTHPSFTLRGFDEASAKGDIDAGVRADEVALYGAKANSPKQPHTPFFRFPGFADTRQLLDFLDDRHYTVFGTDLWAADWKRMTPEVERRKVLDLLEAAPNHNGIVLFHDTIESTAQMLPALLADLKQRGYSIVHLDYDPNGPAPALTQAGPDWSSETEAIIAHLRVPIKAGAHHAGESAHPFEFRSDAAPKLVKPAAVAGGSRQTDKADKAVDCEGGQLEPNCAPEGRDMTPSRH